MILGIDPGGVKDHALALFVNGELLETHKTSDISFINRSVHWAEKVFLENQYYGGNASTLILLAHRTGMIMGLCELHQTEYEMVAPTTWQSRINLPRKDKTLSDYKWKKLHETHICDRASEIAGYEITDIDISAAVLIGYSMGVMDAD